MHINGEWVDEIERAMYDDFNRSSPILPGTLFVFIASPSISKK